MEVAVVWIYFVFVRASLAWWTFVLLWVAGVEPFPDTAMRWSVGFVAVCSIIGSIADLCRLHRQEEEWSRRLDGREFP